MQRQTGSVGRSCVQSGKRGYEMSRIGKKPVLLEKGVNVGIEGQEIVVKGPKGELRRALHPKISLRQEDGKVFVDKADESKEADAIQGLYRVLVGNMVTGVSKGFEKGMELVGIGYKVELKGKELVFEVGYSHPVNVPLPEGIEARVDKNKITLLGRDKEALGNFAAQLRFIREPDSYKGKGLRYANEALKLKAGKAGKSGKGGR